MRSFSSTFAIAFAWRALQPLNEGVGRALRGGGFDLWISASQYLGAIPQTLAQDGRQVVEELCSDLGEADTDAIKAVLIDFQHFHLLDESLGPFLRLIASYE